MKILHAISAPAAGGAEMFVKDLVLNSKLVGITASILFISTADEIGRSEEYQSTFLEALDKNDIKYAILPKGSKRNPLIGNRIYKKFIELVKPDCIHSHLLSGIIYHKFFSNTLPLVYTHHSTVIQAPKVLFKYLMKHCNSHIGISKVCSVFLQNYLPKNKTCQTIYNSVDFSRLKNGVITIPNKESSGLYTILSIGRISQDKNYQLLLEVIYLLKNNYDIKFQLLVAGDGDPNIKDDLEAYISEHDLGNRVFLLGNRSDIGSLISTADLFVMSSLVEGFPIALLEAQALGLPCIVTDVGGCKELLEITKGGITVQLHNPKDFAFQIYNLLSNPEKLATYSESAILQSKSFSINKCIFIHVPKVAGISINHAIYGITLGHYSVIEIPSKFPNLFSDSFTFALVRNAWDRLLSAYRFTKQGRTEIMG
jgi:glycosyltransferase involved in cell wall biosynthesis